jgi:fibronectin-binding autotransporter adhesin
VTGATNNAVAVIDTSTNTVTTSIPVGSHPQFAGICSNGNALLASGGTFVARTSGALACTLASGASGSAGPVFTGGALQVAGANIASSLPVTLQSQGGTIDTNGNNATLSGTISGPGSLTKIGAGTLTLTGNNSYSGGTALNAGTLAVGSNTALGTGALTFANGTTLQAAANGLALANAMTLNGTDTVDTQSNALTLVGTLSGSGSLIKIGAGTLVLTGANTYTGTTTISAGTLQLGNGGTSGSIAGNVVNNGVFAVNRSDTFTFGDVISGTGAFQQNGTGTTILTATNTYSGPTTVNAGTRSP